MYMYAEVIASQRCDIFETQCTIQASHVFGRPKTACDIIARVRDTVDMEV